MSKKLRKRHGPEVSPAHLSRRQRQTLEATGYRMPTRQQRARMEIVDLQGGMASPSDIGRELNRLMNDEFAVEAFKRIQGILYTALSHPVREFDIVVTSHRLPRPLKITWRDDQQPTVVQRGTGKAVMRSFRP